MHLLHRLYREMFVVRDGRPAAEILALGDPLALIFAHVLEIRA